MANAKTKHEQDLLKIVGKQTDGLTYSEGQKNILCSEWAAGDNTQHLEYGCTVTRAI